MKAFTYILALAASASAQTYVSSGLGSYSYYGCITDSGSPRALYFQQSPFTPATVEHCVSLCSASGYTYAGLEYYRECYCDNSTTSSSTTASGSDCSYSCDGNNAEACGGASRLSLYSIGGVAPASAVTQQNPGDTYGYLGCYADSTTSRTLQGAYDQIGTPLDCMNYCSNGTTVYTYAGLENGDECYCSQAMSSSATSTGCTTDCVGAHQYVCGGSNAVGVYKLGTGSSSSGSGSSGSGSGSSKSSSSTTAAAGLNSAQLAASASPASLASYRSATAASYLSRVSAVSASKAAASSAKISRDNAASVSRANAKATKSLIQAAHVSSLTAADAAHSQLLASQRSTKAAGRSSALASSRTLRLIADLEHSSSLSSARAYKSSVNAAHAASLASVDSAASVSRASVSAAKAAAAAAKTAPRVSATLTSSSASSTSSSH